MTVARGTPGPAWLLRQTCSALCLTATFAGARHALAAESRFEWDAPAACPSGEQVRAALGELLGPAPLDFGPFLSVRAYVEKRGSEWELVLDLDDGERKRSRIIDAPECVDLVEAARVAIALAVDGEREAGAGLGANAHGLEGAPSEAAAPSPATSSVAPDAPLGPLPDAPASEASPRATYGLHATALVDGAAAPGAALGVSVGAELLQGPWSVGPYLLFLPGEEEAAGAVALVRFSLLAGGLHACYRLSASVVQTRACAGVEVGRLYSSGKGLVDANGYSDWWVTPSAGLRFRFPLGSGWAIQAQGDALVPLIRESYVVNQTQPVFRPPSVGLRAALGLSLSLD